ncbi:WxL protein peptidoglycan domain-containing protein [Polymorphospora rubra]|uniref:DUF916 domain-containing protein n=1 Tax=Polymorphospora rubra TaxID=338584 RepID=A0A810NFR0_9ACTN|nr:DUF916 domain-containing protein [Polymorphospora rubra]BCJ70283.1 hypothetical protein Prubr_73040 [Polymorphospora rubra]
MRHRWLPALLAAALLGVPTPVAAAPEPSSPAGADPGITWAVQPSDASGPTGRSYFVYDAAPGQRIDDQIAVRNLGRTPLTLHLYGTDAFTTDDGSFGLLPASQPPTGVGTWATIGEDRVVVPPGRHVVVPFHLVVPADASPGDHAGGLIASVATVGTTADGQRVNVDRRVAARVYLRVAGPLTPALQIETLRVTSHVPLNPLDRGTVEVRYRLRNTGNVRIAGTGSVAVSGPFRWELARTGTVDVPELLPGGVTEVTERITGLPAAGRLDIAVHVTPSTMDVPLSTVTRTHGVWAVPWVLLVLGLLAAALAVGAIRRRRPGTTRPAAPATTDGPVAATATPAGRAG